MAWKIIFYNFGLKIIFGHFPFYVEFEYIIHTKEGARRKNQNLLTLEFPCTYTSKRKHENIGKGRFSRTKYNRLKSNILFSLSTQLNVYDRKAERVRDTYRRSFLSSSFFRSYFYFVESWEDRPEHVLKFRMYSIFM